MAKAKAKKKEVKRSRKPRKEAVDPKTLVGQLVELTKPVKTTYGKTQRTLPAWTIGRVEKVHHDNLFLCDPMTGDLFARSVPAKYVQLYLASLTPAQMGDMALVRMNKAELENEVINLRTSIRRLQAMDMGDPRLVELFLQLPEYGRVPDAAVPLVEPENQDETSGSVEGLGGDDAGGDSVPQLDDADESGDAAAAAVAASGDPDPAAEPEGFGRDGDDDVDPDLAVEVAVAGAVDGSGYLGPDESGAELAPVGADAGEQPNAALTDDRDEFPADSAGG